MQKVLIPTKLNPLAADYLRDQGIEVVQDANAPLDELIKAHNDVTGLIVRSEKITAEVLEQLPNLKGIVRAGAGYNTIDTRTAAAREVLVMNTPGANSNAVAEESIGMMIASARHFVPADASVRSGLWEKSKFMGHELTGKTVGIAGFGNIGQLLAKRLRGFDVKLKVFDPYVSADKAREYNADVVSLEDLFAESDFISLHMPATPETEKIVSTKLLQSTKDGVVIVNCARSEIFDEEALREVKKVKKIFFANDVYDKDAPGDKSCVDVADIMLPHLGASSAEANANAARMAAHQIADLLLRGIGTHVVNKTIPDDLKPEYLYLGHTLTRLASSAMAGSPLELQLTFYGDLARFEKYLLPPVVSSLTKDSDIVDYGDAIAALEQQGITLKVREGNEGKGYGESITIDLVQEGGKKSRVSVRGTITEGNIIVSRIDEFDKLYFDPAGHSLSLIYDDRPGVLAQITQALAFEGINIEDIRSPRSADGSKSIAVLKLNAEVSAEFVKNLCERLECHSGFYAFVNQG